MLLCGFECGDSRYSYVNKSNFLYLFLVAMTSRKCYLKGEGRLRVAPINHCSGTARDGTSLYHQAALIPLIAKIPAHVNSSPGSSHISIWQASKPETFELKTHASKSQSAWILQPIKEFSNAKSG